MTRKLLLATRNQKKKRELETILSSSDIDLVTLDDIEGMPEIEEDGDTFAANAIKKAQTIALLSGFVTLADDSGLVVDALNGAPGIFSARFAGPEASDEDNNRKLLALMQDVLPEHRTARFVCVIAVATPEGNVTTVHGVCEGSIGFQAHGQNGFGYDPFFIPSGFQQTFAELSDSEKNRISHRGRALLSARQVLQQILSSEGTA